MELPKYCYTSQPADIWQGGMLSFKGRCFTYDVSADGYLRGEAHALPSADTSIVVAAVMLGQGVSGIFLELKEFSREAC